MENVKKYKILINKQENGNVSNINFSDFYLNLFLTKYNNKYSDYVDVNVDTYKTQIDRQLINPFFIELAFFETVNKISSGSTNHSESVYDKASDYKITINGA